MCAICCTDWAVPQQTFRHSSVGICKKFVIDACYMKGDILQNVGINRIELVLIPKAEMCL